MTQPIDIFLTCYMRPELTRNTLEYLKKRTKYPYRLFIIHNGGNEEILIDQCEDFFLIIDPGRNIGIHPAWNIALALAESEYFITTDNDILVPDLEPDWLTQLVNLMDTHPDYGAIALQPHKFIGLDIEQHPTDGEIVNTPMTGAVMRLMRREAVWKAGGWERIIRASRNHEEATICGRLSQAGYKFGYSAKMKAFHMFGTEGETDYWGYDKDAKPEDHGHRDVWPPLWVYGKISDYDPDTFEKK